MRPTVPCVATRAGKYVQQDQNCADGDGGVRDVERRIAVGTEQHFEEIGDCAVKNAVGEIAGGAAEKQR